MVLGTLYEGKPDDSFGPLMLKAHRQWSKNVGFGVQDVVTPAMWATGVGVTLLLDEHGVTLADGTRVSVDDAARAARDLAPAEEAPPAP
jgi:hypothetical protein